MFDQFSQAPKTMKLMMAALAAIAVLAVTAMIGRQALLIAAAGLVVIAGAIVAWQMYQQWSGHQRSRALSSQLAAHSSGTPSAIHDPALIATLDRLRENFARGVEKFEAVGKDLYSLPWYVVCGEPGSGKTEAVRRCKVGFPPGLQDEMQGAGGTINMHWWFTNYAVLIDTAGKLLFQEAPPGSTTEWTEFLTLLRKTRPHCPINGLLLVIPSESLIKDSMDDIAAKAGKIARQLDTIQRTLDVRFPVFVLITKCDKIVGFREFFSGVKDPQLQDQMTGWSNPAPLDTPFQMEAVNRHLAEVVQRIGRRRLGMLKDPMPTEHGKRRADEVDALFALSASIGALAPRLRKYLETIFAGGAHAAKPLFLRGIYFTSALTEGKELDTELAAALGLTEDQLPATKAWERERSYFLKDLFLQKVFREKGLVTRATNTTQLIKNRQRVIGGVVAAGTLAVLGISFAGYKALKSSVGSELVYWRAGAKAENWAGAKWRPVVNGRLEYTGNDIVALDVNQELPIMQYHEKLQQLASADLHIPAVFKPVESLAMQANPRRRQAQRVLFEASVIAPVVEANRDRLVNSDGWSAADSERLAALIRLEGAIHLKGQPGYDADYPAEDFFYPLLGATLKGVADGQDTLAKLMQIHEWTYFRGGAGRGEWPPLWLSRGQSLRDNQPLVRGWDALDRAMQSSQGSLREAIQTIQSGRLTVARFTDAEKAFLKTVAQPRHDAAWSENVLSAWSDLSTRRTALDKLVTELKNKTGVTGDQVTLDASYRATVARMKGEAGQASQLIRDALTKQKAAADAAAASTGPARDFTLYRDLERRLAGLDTQVSTQLGQLMSASEEAQLADLDIYTLVAENGTAVYATRFAAYTEVMQILAPSGETGSLIGRLGEAVTQQGSALAGVRERLGKYVGALRTEFTAGMRSLLEVAATKGVETTVDAYRSELDKAFPDSLGYPLGTGPALTAEQLKATLALLTKVRADAAAAGLPADARRSLESRFKRLELMAAFAGRLAGADGNPAPVRLVLPSDADQEAIIQRSLGSGGAKQAITRVFKSVRVSDRSYPLQGLPESVVLDKLTSAAPLSRLEFFTTVGPKSVADAMVEPGAGWGVLRLLQQGSTRRAEGKEWDVLIRLNHRGTELILPATVAFEQALPALDQWPAAAR
ncbi:MAG: type VI secretion protein IcmF/TssM N-terminal domain-containing protein [Lacunisphaera sp.]|nr:type VI secretion protein IcmF/TssM N-terminal domain-containing protein [Lacunisphaera sp.]